MSVSMGAVRRRLVVYVGVAALTASGAEEAPGQDTGKQLFESVCVACHTTGTDRLVGPGLAGVEERRDIGPPEIRRALSGDRLEDRARLLERVGVRLDDARAEGERGEALGRRAARQHDDQARALRRAGEGELPAVHGGLAEEHEPARLHARQLVQRRARRVGAAAGQGLRQRAVGVPDDGQRLGDEALRGVPHGGRWVLHGGWIGASGLSKGTALHHRKGS